MAPVGSFHANGFGLFDMHGNVEEISRAVPGVTGVRATFPYLRGGSFHHPAWRARSSFRFSQGAEYKDFFIGVRAAREIQP